MATHQKKHVQSKGTTKELVLRDEKAGESYGEVLNPVGDCRFECILLNGEKVIATLRGALVRGPKKQFIKKEDFVLLQITEDKKTYYIIHKYSPEDKKKLARQGELNTISNTNEGGTKITMASDLGGARAIDDDDIDDLFIDNI
jgi:translation initiation factor IF-1